MKKKIVFITGTRADYGKIKNFYKELSTLSYTTSPEKLANSLKLKETGIIIKIADGDYDFNVDSGAIIFNNMQVSDTFPFIHYRDVDENFYKIHEDIDKLHSKIDKVLYAILGGLGATILTLIGLLN